LGIDLSPELVLGNPAGILHHGLGNVNQRHERPCAGPMGRRRWARSGLPAPTLLPYNSRMLGIVLFASCFAPVALRRNLFGD
jgi:hypothetical protein